MSEDDFDPKERAAQKAASRAEDAEALARGEKSVDDLRQENSPFSQIRVRPDFAAAHARR